jgi:hypothetical protein
VSAVVSHLRVGDVKGMGPAVVLLMVPTLLATERASVVTPNTGRKAPKALLGNGQLQRAGRRGTREPYRYFAAREGLVIAGMSGGEERSGPVLSAFGR